MKKEILIIGGGFAGLASGVELASHGHHVTLIEKRSHLGGRAYSFRDPTLEDILDNGQHVLMGCYHETIQFLKKIGTLDRVDFQKRLSVDFVSPSTSLMGFRSRFFPHPFGLLAGFFLFRGLSWKEKMSVWHVARFFRKNKEEDPFASLEDRPLPQWLDELGQSKTIQERFWFPLAYAALNDRPEVCSAALFAKVLKESLFARGKDSSLGLPSVGLSELYVDAAWKFITDREGHVLMKSPVAKLHFRGREFQEVELEGGRRLSAEILLVTVPFTALKKILPESMLYEDPFFSKLGFLKPSPIVSVNLWLDRSVTDRPFVGFWGTKTHWLFNKQNRIHAEGRPYVSLVTSGAHEELLVPGPLLVERALSELRSVFPKTMREATLLKSRVLKDPEATLSPQVGVSQYRLPQKTPYRNFFLAGDWTDTGLPATIESAVRSAQKAVSLIEG